MPLSSRTCVLSTEEALREVLTLCRGASRASHIVASGNVRGGAMPETTGRTHCKSCESVGLLSSSEKMSMGFLIPMPSKSWRTWRRQATARPRVRCRLVPLVPHICGATCSSWPTPRASQDQKPIRLPTRMEACHEHGWAISAAVGKRWPELIGQYLHPGFFETLMGWPIAWTELDAQATAWFRSKRRQRGKSSGG